jgi:hypothetical protein
MVVGHARRSSFSERLRSRDRTHFSSEHGSPAVSGSTHFNRSSISVGSFFPRAACRRPRNGCGGPDDLQDRSGVRRVLAEWSRDAGR